jgi:hypothetical protein
MKEQRNLSGMYFRVERNGKWENVCFEDLEHDEMYAIMNSKDKEYVMALAEELAKTLNSIGEELDIVRCSNGE